MTGQPQKTPLFDVVAINIKTLERRVVAKGKGESNAEAIMRSAAMRRGMNEEFFEVVPAGTGLNAPQ